jgi:hypothetical protein
VKKTNCPSSAEGSLFFWKNYNKFERTGFHPRESVESGK